jgi:hypothetical protein
VVSSSRAWLVFFRIRDHQNIYCLLVKAQYLQLQPSLYLPTAGLKHRKINLERLKCQGGRLMFGNTNGTQSLLEGNEKIPFISGVGKKIHTEKLLTV